MKRKFTLITAALALLTILAVPIGMWGQTYNLISSVSDITTGEYVIAAKVGTTYYAMSNTFASKISGTSITVTDGKISSSDAEDYVVTITKDSNGRISIFNGTKYLNCKSSKTDFEVGTTAYYHDVSVQSTGGTFQIKYQTAERAVIYSAGTTQKFGNYATSNVDGSSYYYVELFKYTASGDPTLSIDPTTADPFTYVVGNGPSDEQLFTVTGTNLPSADITVSVPTDCAFEITDATEYGNSVTIESGDIISVRLKASLALGDYDATLSITSTGADPINVALSGSVTNPPTYTVTYDGNGATSGTAPTDATAYTSGQTVTVLGPGTLAKTGNTFVLWNTKADGTGTDYDEDDTFDITANTTLYAQWLPNSHTVTLPTADSYGTYIMDKTNPVDYGTTVTLTYTPASGYELYSATWSVNSTPIVGDSFVMPDEDVTVTVALAERTSVTYDFQFDVIGSTGWTNSYAEHVVEYTEANVTFAAAGKQTGTITDIPVTKGNPVSIVMKSGMPNPTGVTFVCRQWSDKAQTITLHYSTDGGTTYAPTGITSTNFTISCTALPANTNAVKITFNSTSNQVGIESATLNFSSDPVISVTPTTLSGFAYTVGGGPTDSQTFTVSGNNLTANITVALPSGSNFELSEDETDWTNSLTLTKDANNAVASTTIYARMKSGLAEGDYSNNVSVTSGALSETVTLSGTVNPAPVSVTYNLATSITPGKHYIIVGKNGVSYFAMNEQKDNNRGQKDISQKMNSEGTVVTAMSNDGLYEFVISGPDSDVHYTIHDEVNNGYLYAVNGSNNYLRNQSFNDNRGIWSITFEGNVAKVVSTNQDVRGTMQYNTSGMFACYASASQSAVYLYEKVETNYTFYHDVAKYTQNESDKWQLIASPVAGVSISVATTTSSDYDLYAYDETNHYWRNQKVAANNITEFVAGKGYLYANAANTTLKFEGAANTFSGSSLSFTGSGETKGLNLVGNPRPYQNVMWIYDGSNVVGDINYLKLNSNGDGFVAGVTGANGEITLVPMEGIIVQATATGQTWKDAASSSKGKVEKKANNSSFLTFNLRGEDSNIIDNAIVRFGTGRNLTKMMLFENSTKVYIPQGGKDYAIVRSEAQGELPINFKAEKNGSYTLSFEAENVEMNYLHLIDNLTGADIDLLQTPSYTFNGKTTDYASRFRLVFSANNVNDNQEGNTNFAYINGEEIVILNAEANATLQVVDLTGRIVSSTNVAHSVSTAGMVPGVYVLRLINGTDVKVQKIIVE